VLDRRDERRIRVAAPSADERGDAFGRQEARAERGEFVDGELAPVRDVAAARAMQARDAREHDEVDREARDERTREFAPVAEAEQGRGRERGDAERSRAQRRTERGHEARQQHVQPDRAAGDEAGGDRARADRGPVQRDEHGRHQARECRERQRADVGERIAAGERARVRPREQHDREDRDAALAQHGRAQVAALAARPVRAHAQRREPVVADHQAQRERRDDDHAGRRAEAAEEGEHGESALALRERQREHVQVRRHAERREARRARLREWQHRQRDRAQVQRQQPARAAHVGGIAALDHARVELVRQRERGERAEQDQRGEAARVARRRMRGRLDVGQLQHERTDREHRAELEQRFEREREHEAAIVRGGRRAPRAEQHREQRHRDRDVERAVLPRRRGRIVTAREQRVAHRDRLNCSAMYGTMPMTVTAVTSAASPALRPSRAATKSASELA
jgi:hypothetical protein